jgi:hypothetical protein
MVNDLNGGSPNPYGMPAPHIFNAKETIRSVYCIDATP